MARTTRRRTIRAIGLAAALAVAACGDDDDAVVTGGTPPTADGAAGDTTGGERPTPGPTTGDEPGGDTDSTSTTDVPDDTTPPPTPDEFLFDPPPVDTDGMTPADGPPGPGLVHVRSSAIASAGDVDEEFHGVDALWFTEFNPSGQPLSELLRGEGVDPDSLVVAGCSVLQTADGLIAQASFHRRADRNAFSSFSMSDNGDGTITWGLFDIDTGQEWSATGQGSATVTFWTHTEPDEPFDTEAREALGLGPRSDDLVILMDFDGEATENFTSEKSAASSRVICEYARPLG